MDGDRAEITRLLEELDSATPVSYERAWETLYWEIIRIARQQRRRWQGDWTLETRALANEVYLRCFRAHPQEFEDRRHFFRVMATMIRRILINYAQRKKAEKRGGDMASVTFEEGEAVDLSSESAAQILDLHRALERLEEMDPRAAEIVRLRFFLGFTQEEIADLLEVSRATVGRDWASARAWLWREMGEQVDWKGD